MRGRVETRKIIEVRVRSKLWSVIAMEGKSSCFWSCTQSEIELANLQNKGLGVVLVLSTVKLNPPSFCLTSSPFTPVVVYKKRHRWLPKIILDFFLFFFRSLKDGEEFGAFPYIFAVCLLS